MKKIDKLILKAFLGPFVITFFIVLFIFVMQFFWKYIDDLVGKGLETSIIFELILYLSASIVVLALPIAILLSSIMTFGNLGESYELVALKSAGISLFRFMLPVLVVVLFLSVVDFLFANYMLPRANLKYYTLLSSVTRKKPALNIKEGVFYDGLKGYVVRVDKKDPDGRTIYGIKIHDHTERLGNNNVLLAEKGIMEMTEDGNFLKFTLQNGVQYEEMKEQANNDRKYEFVRRYFEEYQMMFDLSNLDFKRTNERIYRSNHRMLSTSQLLHAVDSLEAKAKERRTDLGKNLKPYFTFLKDTTLHISDSTQLINRQGDISTFLQCVSVDVPIKKTMIKRAISAAKNTKGLVQSNKNQTKHESKRINRCLIEFHNKITFAVACLVLFLIGAPLGAIIRKGGLGTPMVVAVVFFTIFHILSTIGKKVAEEGVTTPFLGMWMATFLLLPLGIFLTYKAMNDSALFNSDAYLERVKKWQLVKYLLKKIYGTKKEEE